MLITTAIMQDKSWRGQIHLTKFGRLWASKRMWVA